MSQYPLIHKYHFSDIRESILSSIQSLFNIDDLVSVVPN